MTKEEMLKEIQDLKREENELWPQIAQLREILRPLEQKRVDLASRRLDLERLVTQVKVIPYYGQHQRKGQKTVQNKEQAKNQLLEFVTAMSAEEREAFVSSLEGSLELATQA